MTCDNTPADEEEFAAFIKAVSDSAIERPVRPGFHPLIKMLYMWTDVHGLPSTAACTLRVLRGVLEVRGPRSRHRRDPFWLSLGWGVDEGVNLMVAFGTAVGGEVVGHIGRDMFIPLLAHDLPQVRGAAIQVIGGWAEDDDEGVFVRMLELHAAREEDPELLDRCRAQLAWLEDDEDDEPEFNDTLREMYGSSGSSDTEEPELDARDRELEPYFEARRGLENSLRALVRHPELPAFLERAVQLHPDITLGMIESSQVSHPCVRQSRLEVHVEGAIVRAWSSELAVSIEPTASDDTWLVFARW